MKVSMQNFKTKKLIHCLFGYGRLEKNNA